MDLEEETVTASVSLQVLLKINAYSLILFLTSLLVGLAISVGNWFQWVCFVVFVIAEPVRLLLGYTGNLSQRPQHMILSLCLASFPGLILSIGLLASFTLHAASQVGLAFIAIFAGLEIPFGLIALWRLQRAQSIRFQLSLK